MEKLQRDCLYNFDIQPIAVVFLKLLYEGVIHGLRHGFRGRLRAVEAPVDMIDQLGGWSLRSIGQGYGDGYPLDLLHRGWTR